MEPMTFSILLAMATPMALAAFLVLNARMTQTASMSFENRTAYCQASSKPPKQKTETSPPTSSAVSKKKTEKIQSSSEASEQKTETRPPISSAASKQKTEKIQSSSESSKQKTETSPPISFAVSEQKTEKIQSSSTSSHQKTIHDCALSGDLGGLGSQLQHYPSLLNAPDDEMNQTALHLVASRNNLSYVKIGDFLIGQNQIDVEAGIKEFSNFGEMQIDAAHADTSFSATHNPASGVQAHESLDLEERYVRPLRSLIDNLQYTVDGNLSSFKRRIAMSMISGFKTNILDAVKTVGTPGELKELIDFCLEESKSMQQNGVSISGFSDILSKLGDLQGLWAKAEGLAQPRAPHAQISAVDNSIEELKGRLVHYSDVVSTDEDALGLLNADGATLASTLLAQEALLAELEKTIQMNREKLASLQCIKETTVDRLEDNRRKISQGGNELLSLTSQAQVLRSTVVEASDAEKQALDVALRAVRAVRASFICRFERAE